jgi:hypothetical protein
MPPRCLLGDQLKSWLEVGRRKLVGLNVDEVKTSTVVVEVDRAEKPVHQMGTTKIRSGFVRSHDGVECRRLRSSKFVESRLRCP